MNQVYNITIHYLVHIKPGTLKDAYRVHIKLPGKKKLAVCITLEDKCIVKTVFVQSKKIQKKVEKWQRKSK